MATETVKLGVAGMTCGHCVMSVTEELTELDSVSNVSVELVSGGVSNVDVFLNDGAAVDKDALKAAIDEAGFELVSID
ncbi:heavy-metal-associated domain-containing protein [Arcanobacterium canis]|uniref:Cation transporter n=1 Tax=Arcanobacterium canis TaxID=999183 RepID=A0ABY8FYC4_9ACTO|nr:cation transporter [Arcanobacterium canis]WFM83528.1 cation transporter [Arcanobacterium canis]